MPQPLTGASWWRGVALIGLSLLTLRLMVAEPFVIPSGSMHPTLLVGDYVVVNHLRYGPHIPFTNLQLPGYAAPERGDIVTFVSPFQADVPSDPTPLLVKRIVGGPGDTLVMNGATVTVNGVPSPDRYTDPKTLGGVRSPAFQWMDRAAVRGSRFGPPPAVATIDRWGPIVVPRGQYFMMGDNRFHSKDSRFLGPVPEENFRGRVWRVYYSASSGHSEPGVPGTEAEGIRWGRLGQRIR